MSFSVLKKGWADFDTVECLAALDETAPAHQCVFLVVAVFFPAQTWIYLGDCSFLSETGRVDTIFLALTGLKEKRAVS